MKRKLLCVLFTISCFTSCTDRYPAFYGTYRYTGKENICGAQFTFYPDKTYAFESRCCFSYTHDSGSFVLKGDRVVLTSLHLHAKTDFGSAAQLSDCIFLYKEHKLQLYNPKHQSDTSRIFRKEIKASNIK